MQIQQTRQTKIKLHENKLLTLVLGKQKVQKLKKLTILLVGVGGIGCQVLKYLTRMAVKKIVMIDLDVIEVSNLNRQFYFNQQHIGKAKAIIANEEISKLVGDGVQIQAIYGSIYDSKWDNYRFYQQFDYVISALDSIKAREYLAKRCTEYGKVMIDGGTAGFYGQSYASVRFVTGCHNCHSHGKDDAESMAVCTIRSRPQKTSHCAAYAKHIFTQLFSTQIISDSNHSQFSPHSIITKINWYFLQQIDNKKDEEKIQQLGRELFDYLFAGQYSEMQEDQKERINLLTYEEAMGMGDNQCMAQYKYSLSQQDTIWTITQYSIQFIHSFCKLAHKFINKLIQQKQQQPQINTISNINPYDKDDYDSNLFINCLCNLRVYNFLRFFNNKAGKQDIMMDRNSNNRMKYISLYDSRKLIGNIIPAIASTNAIAAALQVKQLVDYLQYITQQHSQIISTTTTPKYFTISPLTQHKLTTSWLALPNKDCKVCSPLNIYFHVECNLWERTFLEFQQFAGEKCLSYNRDVYCESLILIKNIKTVRQSANKKKVLGFKSQLVREGTLTVEFLPTTGVSDIRVKIVLVHLNKEQLQQQKQQKNENKSTANSHSKFTILNQPQVDSTISALQILRQQQQHHHHHLNQQQQQQFITQTPF